MIIAAFGGNGNQVGRWECIEKDCAEEAVPVFLFDGSLFFIPKTIIKTTIVC